VRKLAAERPDGELYVMRELPDIRKRSTVARLTIDAFREVHQKILEAAYEPGAAIPRRYGYPNLHLHPNGMPGIVEASFESAPKNYGALIHQGGLLGAFGGRQLRLEEAPSLKKLCDFAENTLEIQSYFDPGYEVNLRFAEFHLMELMVSAADAYIQRWGIGEPTDKAMRQQLGPLLRGIFSPQLSMRIVVPVALTFFEVDRFRMGSDLYLTRLSRRLQLSRSSLDTIGSGAHKPVVQAATHGFVFTGWTVSNETYSDLMTSLRHEHQNIIELVDRVFALLRIATGISSGYAQVLYMPYGWTLTFDGDLQPLYGFTCRKYPLRLA
jgi:hypothetical protein